MKSKKINIIALCGFLILPTVWAQGNPKKGAEIFAEECGDCHSASGKNKKGPSLIGLNGRQAGSLTDYAGYSDAMKQMGITWTAEKIDSYIAQPRKVVSGGKMKYDGLSDAKARADVISYILSLR